MDEHIKTTIETYDKIAKEWTKRWGSLEHIQLIEKYLSMFMENLNGNRILDVGCGAGRDAVFFASKGYDITSIDLSDEMLNIAKKRTNKVKFLKMDMRKLEFPDSLFNGIHCWAAFQHLKRDEAESTLNEFNRVLKPHGILLIAIHEGEAEGFSDHTYSLPRYFCYYTEKILKDLFKKTRFEVIFFDRATKSEKGSSMKVLHFIVRKKSS